MRTSNLISDGLSQDVRPGDIVNVVVVVSVVVFPVLLSILLRSSCRKMSKNRSLRVGSREEHNGVTGWKYISEEDLFIASSRS